MIPVVPSKMPLCKVALCVECVCVCVCVCLFVTVMSWNPELATAIAKPVGIIWPDMDPKIAPKQTKVVPK